MKKPIAILGGMGSFAGVSMVERMLRLSGAVKDEEFPSLIYYNLPVLGMDSSGVNDHQKLFRCLRKSVLALDRFGCSCIIIACNSAHAILGCLQKRVSTPILDMVGLACRRIEGPGTVGILCSESTRCDGLYDNVLRNGWWQIIYPEPEDQARINEVIVSVILGDNSVQDCCRLLSVAHNLAKRGANSLLVGCTELSVILKGSPMPLPTVDAAQAVIEFAWKKYG